MYCKLMSFLVVGLKKSGVMASMLLLEKGATVYAYDDNKSNALNGSIEQLCKKGLQIVDNPEPVLDKVDAVVLSPGVPIDHDVSVLAKSLKKRVIGEMELASLFIKAPIIGVTGTNGKTTTCSLISHVLTSANEKNELVGNIGTPLSAIASKNLEDALVVLEISSFQLETIYSLTPHIACVLNVSEDHLDRHYNMDNYVFLKKKLLLNLRESEYAVLNFDDKIVKSFSNDTRAKVIWFSTKQKVEGAYILDEDVYYGEEKITSLKSLNLNGEHLIQNFLASLCVFKLLGITTEEIINGVNTFKGVRHRLESVRNYNDIEFINDSKSTNPNSCITAVKSMKSKTMLIIGGYEKGLDYTLLMKEIKKSKYIKGLVITGASCKRMYQSAVNENIENVSLISDFDTAIKVAFMQCKSGENVLFSPATSSFDLFLDFEQRGDKFVEVVNSL